MKKSLYIMLCILINDKILHGEIVTRNKNLKNPINTIDSKKINYDTITNVDEKQLEDLEDILDQNTIGTGAGTLNKNFDTMSDVVTLGGITTPHSTLVTKGGVEIMFTGKERIEGIYGVNTKYLNNEALALDSYFVPGKSTTDIGMLVTAGKYCGYDKEVLSLGIDLRSRTTWGKSNEIAKTTPAILEYGNIPYGAHSHMIGIPVIYLRGVDLTLNLNALFGNRDTTFEKTQKLKLGFFPLEIGRGISLGAGYLVSPDVLSYAPVDVIQEFAPGFLLYGELLKSTLDYRLYLGIIKNLSGSHADLIEKTKIYRYGNKLFPYRGSGVFNIVSAFQLDWKCVGSKNRKGIVSPYIILAHEGAGKIILPEDSFSNIATYGLEFEAEQKGVWDLSFEFAKNSGTQYVFGIDTNTLLMEQRTCNIEGAEGLNPNTSVGIITNSGVIFNGYTDEAYSSTTDIVDKNTTYLGSSSSRQKAIENVYQDASSNGKVIFIPNQNYTLKNSEDRFHNPYTNILQGYMVVCDIGRYITLYNTSVKIAIAGGYASGDNNPNKSLLQKNDYIKNCEYSGFVGIQEIYSGKMVRSAYLLSGPSKNPRVGSIPAAILNDEGEIINTVAYPTPISGFNNIMYAGSSLNFIHEGCAYHWKWNPNVLIYGQPSSREIYNQEIIKKLSKNEIDPFLGTEINLFLEIISQEIEGFKIFAVGSCFFPGQYYKDLSQIPLNEKEYQYLKNKDGAFVPKSGTSNAYYVNIGLEFKF